MDAQKGRPTETDLLNTQNRQLFKMNTPQIIFIQDMCCECSSSFEAQSKQMFTPPPSPPPNICCGCSGGPSHRDGLFENPEQIGFKTRVKTMITMLHSMFLFVWTITLSILLKEPFALKNSETEYFTSIFSTPSYSDIVPIDNFDLTFFYFYFVFEVFDTIQFQIP